MTTTEQEHWGLAVRERREAALVTQRELAARCKVSQALVSRIERFGDRTSPEIVARIEIALAALEAGVQTRTRGVVRRALSKLSEVEIRVLGLERLVASVNPPKRSGAPRRTK